MSDAYIIEVQGNAVGIIVRNHRSEPAYKFLSAHCGLNSLEGMEFAGPLQAESAARKLLREKPQAMAPETWRMLAVQD
jgi:hypothetical protein